MPSYRDVQPPGFEITPELKTWESQRKCPRCGFELYAGEKGGIRVEACGWCGGVFLESEQAALAFAQNSRAPEELAAKVEKATRQVVLDDRKTRECPHCGNVMFAKVIGKVTVDTCAHGTWFDRTELGAAMRELRGESDEVDLADAEDLRRMKAVGLEVDVEKVRIFVANIFEAIFR